MKAHEEFPAQPIVVATGGPSGSGSPSEVPLARTGSLSEDTLERSGSPCEESLERVRFPFEESLERTGSPSEQSQERIEFPFGESLEKTGFPFGESLERTRFSFEEFLKRTRFPSEETLEKHQTLPRFEESIEDKNLRVHIQYGPESQLRRFIFRVEDNLQDEFKLHDWEAANPKVRINRKLYNWKRKYVETI